MSGPLPRLFALRICIIPEFLTAVKFQPHVGQVASARPSIKLPRTNSWSSCVRARHTTRLASLERGGGHDDDQLVIFLYIRNRAFASLTKPIDSIDIEQEQLVRLRF